MTALMTRIGINNADTIFKSMVAIADTMVISRPRPEMELIVFLSTKSLNLVRLIGGQKKVIGGKNDIFSEIECYY